MESTETRIRRLMKLLTEMRLPEPGDPPPPPAPMPGVREPLHRGPGGPPMAVALSEPDDRVDDLDFDAVASFAGTRH